MKKIRTLIPVFLFVLIGCAPPQSPGTEEKADSAQARSTIGRAGASMVVAQISDTSRSLSDNYEEGDYYSNIINPITISAESKLYEKPDTNSKVLRTLAFGTPLRAGRGPRQVHTVTSTKTDAVGRPYTYTQHLELQWFHASLPEGKGYIKASDVASHSFSDKERGLDYFVVTDVSPEYNPDGAVVCIYDRNKQTLVDSLRIKTWIQVVKFFDDMPWSNVNMLIRASKISAECGGYGGTHVIVDINGKLTEIISSSYTNNDDDTQESLSSEVLFPVKTPDGELVMAENGDLAYRAPFHFKDIINLPASIANRKEELVIKKIHLYKPVLNTQHEPVPDSAGNTQWKETHREEFYCWNGSKLARAN